MEISRRAFLKAGAISTALVGVGETSSGQIVRPATGPLRAHPLNPRYFTDGSGKAIFLTGSHTWANLQDTGVASVPTFDWQGYLAMMQSHNHNFMRLWQWQQSAWAPWTPDKILFEPTLYLRTGPGTALDGGPKVNLDLFNPAYFDRMRARVSECRNRGIYCAVQLFQGFSYNREGECGNQTWSGHPFNAQNNINTLDGNRNNSGQPDLDNPKVRERHTAYLKKVIETVGDLDNVLYEVVNEGGGKDWDWWVVDSMHRLEKEKGKQHPVGLTGEGAESMEQMMASNADWISPAGRKFMFDPPAWEGKKVSVNDTDHLWGHGGTVAWAWKSFVRGHNTLLMDTWEPIAGSPCPEVNWGPRPGYPLRDLNRRDDWTWEPVRKAIGLTRSYALRMDLASMTPQDTLASSAYCLANPEREFLVYLPEGDQVDLDMRRADGNFAVEWMHPVDGTVTPGGAVTGSRKDTFTAPFIGAAVLYVKKTNS